MLFPALLICLALLFSGCGSAAGGPVGSGGYTKNPVQGKNGAKTKEKTVYIVTGMDTEGETITLYNLSSDETVQYPFGLTTKFEDRNGGSTSWSNFLPGTPVTISQNEKQSVLSTVAMAKDTWEQEDIRRYFIDADRGILKIGDTNYRLTDQTRVYSDDALSDLSAIGTSDVLRVNGRDKDVLSVAVTSGHGKIKLMNTDKFNDSLIQIGRKVITRITGEGMEIEVPEGTYDLTVAKDGYGGTEQVTVPRGQTVTVNLEELAGAGPGVKETKYCTITFTTTVDGAKIYLDGKEIGAGESMQVAYGNHSLKVVCEGYDTWNRTLVVNSPSAEILLDPTTQEDSDKDSGSSGSSDAESGTADDSSGNGSSSSDSSSQTSGNSGSANSLYSGTNYGRSSGSSQGTSDRSGQALDYLTTMNNMISNILGSSSD